MATIKVIHQQRAYIDGRTYLQGEEAEIDAKDFSPSTHTAVDKDGKALKVQPKALTEGDVADPEPVPAKTMPPSAGASRP